MQQGVVLKEMPCSRSHILNYGYFIPLQKNVLHTPLCPSPLTMSANIDQLCRQLSLRPRMQMRCCRQLRSNVQSLWVAESEHLNLCFWKAPTQQSTDSFISTLYKVLVPAVLVRGGFFLVEDFRVDLSLTCFLFMIC